MTNQLKYRNICIRHYCNIGVKMSRADQIFIENCKQILEYGVWNNTLEVRPKWADGTPAYTKKVFALVNRYNLAEEFPILTIRRTFFKSAIDEILWIWQKKSNTIQDLNSKIWDSWADENGSIGKAYGYQLGQKYQFKEGVFDQVDKVLFDLKNTPASRRIIAHMYNVQDLKDMHLYPCAYSMTFNVSGNKLNAILNQRSQDMLTASNWNVVQYSILLIMFAKASGLEAGELVHVIADAHIYDRHIPMVEKLITQKQYQAPILKVENITDFYKFTVDSFQLENYQYTSFEDKIPVAI